MKGIIAAVLLSVLSVVGYSESSQRKGPPPKNNGHYVRPKVHNYHLQHGHSFSHGYYYIGPNHYHWSHHYWDNRYGCYLYYDPGLRMYYYWHAPHYCFYPITYRF